MTNIFNYLTWRGDLSFSQDPVNRVDGLVFSALAYIRYGGSVEEEPHTPVSLREAAEVFFALPDHDTRSRVQRDQELLAAAAKTRRFGECRICLYRDQFIPEQETQFAAMTFLLDDGSLFLSFRGTDNSLVGWKEDFNMTFLQTIPAQRLALQYAREVAMEWEGPLYFGGHSKGGNLAVFAAARSSPMVQSRIRQVFNNDGPGFTKYLMGDPGYLAMVPKIQTYVPQSSVIGMLLEHEEAYTVIHSESVGVLQHDLYTWDVQGKEFQTVEQITGTSRFLDATIKAWFASMTNQERNQLVDVMFTLLESGGAENVRTLANPKHIRGYIKTVSSDEHLRRVLSTEFQSLMEAAKAARSRFEDGEMQLPGAE